MNIRCPHCHNPIEVVEDSLLAEILCPTCGSSFSLIGGDTTSSFREGETRRLAHFELVRELGFGKFGSVWLARDTQLDRNVAIKIPRATDLDASQTDLFLRDARAAAQLKHPSIVSVHEVGRDGDTIYIVSDYVEGANLKEWLSAQRLSFRESAELVVKVAEALEHAHSSGVVHRDLKPSNIMLDSSGEPHVIDFGLAKREAGEITMTVEGHILGTPAYMSPEQAKGKGHDADARSDVYSLGVILFELLTGELPFRGDSQMLLLQIQRDEPPRPRRLNHRIPRDLETITLKCLEKEPGRRYASAEALADDLRCWLDGKPIVALPIGRIARGWRWCKRQPVVAGLSAAVVLTLLVGIVVSTFFAIQATVERDRADARAADALAEKERADANAAAASDEKLRADQKATEAQANAQQVLAEKQRADEVAASERTARAEAEASAERARAEQERSRRLLYRADMNLAQSAWEGANVGLVHELLAQHNPQGYQADLRGWEWYYQRRQRYSELRSLTGHRGPVESVAFSPDGRRLASADYGTTVTLWDAETGEVLHTLEGHTLPVTSVAFSSDGRRLASASRDQTVKLWDAATGQEVRTLKGHTSGVHSVAFSPDGRRLASASWDETVKLWDAETGEELRTLKGHTSSVLSVAFSPDGRRLASASHDKTVKLWDAETFEELRTLKGHTSGVLSVAFSPDGRRLASASWDNAVKLWDAETGEELHTLEGHTLPVTSVAFSSDGRRLASASVDRTVKLWDAETGEELRTLKGHTHYVTSVAFSPDGRRLASASWDETVKLWDAETGEELRTLKGHTKTVTSVAFSPDGRRLASASNDGTVKLWDAATGEELRTLKGHIIQVRSVAFSPDGRRLASASYDETVKLWDAETGEELRTLKGHTSGVLSVAFSPDGRRLASASGQTVKLWDAETGEELRTLKGHTQPVMSVAFSPDGRRLASASNDRTVKLWDAETGEELRTLRGHGHEVGSVAFSPDGRWLAVSAGNLVYLYDSLLLDENTKMAHFLTRGLIDKLVTEDAVISAIGDKGYWKPAMRKAAFEYVQLARIRREDHWRRVCSRLELEEIDESETTRNLRVTRALAKESPTISRYRWAAALLLQRARRFEDALLEVPAAGESPDAVDLAIRTSLLLALNRRDEAVETAARIQAPKLADELENRELVIPYPAFRAAAVALGVAGRWAPAAELYARAYEPESVNRFAVALMHLAAGNADAYRTASLDLLSRHGETTDTFVAYLVALTCTVGEDAVEDMDKVVALANRAAGADPRNPVYKTILGAAQYRAGLRQEAIATLTQAVPQHALAAIAAPNQLDLIYVSRLLGEVMLAHAYRDEGKNDQLQKQLASLRALIEKLKTSPPPPSAGTVPWAIPFGITMGERELAKLSEPAGSK